jgi:putative transposase
MVGKRGPNPTDRAKQGTEKHLLVEQDGGPLAVVIAGANVNDHLLLAARIDAIVIARPNPEKVIEHLCLDKAYDQQAHRRSVRAGGVRRAHPPDR